MLNLLFNPKKAKKHPLEMMIIGFFYASISIFLGSWIFPEYASLAIVFFTVFSCIYIIQGTIKNEEAQEKNYNTEKWLLKKHSKTIKLFLYIFLGFMFAYTFWTITLPTEHVSSIFEFQEKSIEGVREVIATGNIIKPGTFNIILLNNIKVLIISLIFAIFYGAGAIYILVWNASVMGYLIGNLAKNTFGIMALPTIITKYFIHGIPEIIAYIIGALAGGILYVSLWKGDFLNPQKNKRTIIDILILISISIIMLIIAALIEVYISPFI